MVDFYIRLGVCCKNIVICDSLFINFIVFLYFHKKCNETPQSGPPMGCGTLIRLVHLEEFS